jgi:hypothetical protein
MAKIYWRRIKAGTRFFVDVPTEKLKEEIRELAIQDVLNGEITAEQYEEFIGEAFQVSE